MGSIAIDTQEKKPGWLKRNLPKGPSFERMRRVLASKELSTVCQEARCPNIWECFSRNTATFMILGDRCTRDCRFCGVRHGPLLMPDHKEPDRIASTVKKLGLSYVTVTSVTRDDLKDGGAEQFAKTVTAIKKVMPDTQVEILVPDFKGSTASLHIVMEAKPDVLAHNMETVPALYAKARPQADYYRSLALLSSAEKMDKHVIIKSGLMLGLGESDKELLQTLRDIIDTGCRILTIGQYLQPTKKHLKVKKFIEPALFDYWREKGLEMGFSAVASGPFVRSSYRASDLFGTLCSEH
jgi:lipoyl synthase